MAPYKGHEISKYWFNHGVFSLFLISLAHFIRWNDELTLEKLWYAVPEIGIVLIVSLRLILALWTAYLKKPGCYCYRASNLYTLNNVPMPDGPLPLPTRLTRYFNHIYALAVGCLIGGVIWAAVQRNGLRMDFCLMEAALMSIFLLFQWVHYPCRRYYSIQVYMLAMEMAERLRNPNNEFWQAVEVERGPVDMSEYLVNMSSEMREEHEACSICTDVFRVREQVVKLTCNHVFHEACAATWIRRVPACPLCRQPVAVQLSGRPSSPPPPPPRPQFAR